MKKFIFLFSFLLLAGCAQKTATSIPPVEPVSISEADVHTHLEYLSSDDLEGRYPGTNGSKMAAEYIANTLKTVGVQPYENGSYFQEFDFVKNVILGPLNNFTLGEDQSFGLDAFMPLAFSASGFFEGSVAFAGYGFSIKDSTDWDDYSSIDVKDRWVLAFRGSPDETPHSPFGKHMAFRKKALVARDKEALGLILVSGVDSNEDPLIKLRYDHAFGDAGIPVVHVTRDVAQAIVSAGGYDLEELEKGLIETEAPNSFLLEGSKITAEISLLKEIVKVPNVLGFIPGTDETLKDEIIVIGAHFDHLGFGGEGSSLAPDTVAVHNGADDNASGVAGILELAENFSSIANRPKRSILIAAFNAEEKGSLGSRYLTENFPGQLDRVVSMINLDMIGRLDKEKLSIGGTGTAPTFPALLDTLNAAYNFKIKMNSEGYGPSDHSNFYISDIPVLFFSTGAHPDYHKPSDDLETLNIPGETLLLKFVYDVVSEIGNADEKPTFTEAGPKENTAVRASFKVTFGIIPSYASQVEGLEIDGTRKDGPAEKAGMLRGDIIISIDGKEIKSIYDYMYRLAELSAGETYNVVVIREEEELELQITL